MAMAIDCTNMLSDPSRKLRSEIPKKKNNNKNERIHVLKLFFKYIFMLVTRLSIIVTQVQQLLKPHEGKCGVSNNKMAGDR